jgi:AcrR family transcriptional regulator
MSSAKQRGYRKVKRADDETRTRARIVDAAEALHAEQGPARTTISAIAGRAGVTRATVYRHFPDDEALFLACSGQWLSRQTLPDPDAWSGDGDDPFATLRAGLTDIYRYFRDGEPMLTSVLRDAAVVPARVKESRLALERAWREELTRALPGRRRKTVQAAVAHAMSFGTWRSLCVDLSLSNAAAVDLMVAMTSAATEEGARSAGRSGRGRANNTKGQVLVVGHTSSNRSKTTPMSSENLTPSRSH